MSVIIRKPAWLDKKIRLADCGGVRALLSGLNLNTVCWEAGCPNIADCYKRGQATFLILGKVCTRNCRFCGIEKGRPVEPDESEAERIAEAVRRLNLKHVVITSVTRDDLPLGGAPYFAKVISLIRRETQAESIEVLIPDFELKREAIKLVIEAGPDVINHNVETVPSLYSAVRPMADYKRSLEVLRVVKKADKDIYTKSGIMLGLGEKEKEVLRLFNDLREVDCDFLTVGQYLSPSRNHYPVVEYIRPERFDFYKEKALEAGFRYVASSPYVRSSYKARECLEKMKNNT